MLWDKKACFKAALVTIILFSLIDVAAMAMPSDSTPFVRVINGSSDPGNPTGYTMLEPDSSPTDGNWIILTGGNSMRIPAMSIRYDGPGIINASPATALSDWPFFSTFGVGSDYLVDVSPHDLTVPFDTYPVYTDDGSGNNDVKATFYGNSNDFKGKLLTIKLLDLTSVSDKIDFTDVTTIKNTMKQLTLSDIKNTEIDSVNLPADGTTGDIPSIESSIGELSHMQQGYYALVVMDYSNPNIPCIVAEAPIIVTKNAMDVHMIDASPKPGDSLTFIEDQQGVPTGASDTYTYVVAIVPEANYTADIDVTSDGTLSGTLVRFHGLSLDETFNVISDGTDAGTTIYFDGMAAHHVALTKDDLNNADYMKQLAKDELAKSNIAIGTITTTDTTGVSIQVPTTDTMPAGKYIVLAAAVDRDTGRIAAINQTTVYLGGTYTFNLVSGWNLISLPLNVQNNDITSIFPADVQNNIVDIWGWDPNAQDYAYYSPDPNDYFYQYYPAITKIETGKAYWVLLDQPATFTVQGTIPVNAPNNADNLQSGWNFVGPTGLTSIPTSTMYPNVVDIWGWDTNIQDYIYYSPDPSDYFYQYYTKIDNTEPGSGYWVLMP